MACKKSFELFLKNNNINYYCYNNIYEPKYIHLLWNNWQEKWDELKVEENKSLIKFN